MQKIVKLNRVFLYCCMVVLFCLQQRVYAAPTQGKPVSLTIKNSSLAEVLRQVSKKSGLYIYFQDADLAGHRNVSLDAKNKPVESVLHELLDERGFSWVEVSENTIAVKKKLEREEGKVEMDTVTTITVTGKVVDEKGEPVIGATVVVKGGKVGTTTSVEGDFVLKGINVNSALLVSNVSFLTQEINVKGRRNLGSIKLKDYVEVLDETQIIGYGQTSRRFDVGNVSTVNEEEISKQPVNNPLLALQGKVPGLTVTQTSGMPGAIPRVQIRGRNSINNGSSVFAEPEPLYIIDGIPINSEIKGGPISLGNGIGNASALSFINVGDIESISVLKDASQTSIYGSRGANGVILITTKKGKAGDNKVDIKVANGIGKVSRRIDLLNRRQYLDMRYEALKNDGVINIPNTPANFDLLRYDTTRYTDWQKELIGGTSNYLNAHFSLSGGGNNIQYFVGGSFYKETQVTPGDFSDRKGSFHFSVGGKSPNQRLYYNFKASYLIDNNTLPGIDFTATALTLSPVAPKLYNDDGSLNWANSTWSNPISRIFEPYQFNNNNITGSALIGYQLTDRLDLKVTTGYNRLQGSSFQGSPFASLNPADWPISIRRATFINTNNSSYVVEPQITYSRTWHGLNLNVLMGGSFQKSDNYLQSTSASGAATDALIKNLAAHTSFSAANSSSEYKYAALFGRIDANFSGKYLINFSMRRDGSSRFGPGRQYGNFASLGTGWIFTQEDFIRNYLGFLSFGKVRVSYGTTGGDAIGDYQYLELYEQTINNYQGTKGLLSGGIFNPDYAWETTKKGEIGIELGFLKDRILISSSYYRNRSSNQLVTYPYPSIVGPGSATTNLPASIQNTGMEFLINTTNIKEKIVWTTSFNISFNKNKLLSFPNLSQSAYASAYRIGHSISDIRLYHLNGVDPQTGSYVFSDSEGKSTNSPDFDKDANTYKNLTPVFYGGVQNTVTLGKLSLDFSFQFVKQTGVDLLYARTLLPGRFSSFGLGNQPTEVLKRWQIPGDNSSIQRFSQNSSILGLQNMARSQSDQPYKDASFVRCKNVSVSYDITSVLPNKKIKNISLYAQGQNLFTITKYKGLDPESQNALSLPPLRIITFGIQAIL